MDFIPATEDQQKEMLKTAGYPSVKSLFADIPQKILLSKDLNIPESLSELEVSRHVSGLASKNRITASFIGAGSYRHFLPSAIRHLTGRSEFYTAYTPYQPEISQGTLQAIYEYQSMICELTGMDVANASMYDCASAVAEAAIMALNSNKGKEILVSSAVHPEYRQVLKTYMKAAGISVKEISIENGVTSLQKLKDSVNENTSAVIVQYPNFFGSIEDLGEIEKTVHANNAVFVVAVSDPVSLGLLKSPGEFNADIVVGEGQSFGNPISFGGPYLGIMATKEAFVRRLPGRIVGATVDGKGNKGFILTLQAREQHIRREKATSNICSNEALCALAATIHLAMLGKNLAKVASQCTQKAHYAFDRLKTIGKPVFTSPFFHEFVIQFKDSKKASELLLKNNILGGVDLGRFYPDMKHCILFCATEMNTKEEIDRMASVLEAAR